jgi:hypothetical protein
MSIIDLGFAGIGIVIILALYILACVLTLDAISAYGHKLQYVEGKVGAEKKITYTVDGVSYTNSWNQNITYDIDSGDSVGVWYDESDPSKIYPTEHMGRTKAIVAPFIWILSIGLTVIFVVMVRRKPKEDIETTSKPLDVVRIRKIQL